MTTERKVILILAAVLLVGGAVVARLAWQQHEALRDADKDAAVTAAEVRVLHDQMALRGKADAAQQALSQQQQANVHSTGDAVRIIREVVTVPGAPAAQPQAVSVSAAQVSDDVKSKLPDSPEYLVQTQASAVETARTLLQCKADQSSLTSCQQDKVDLTAEVDAEHKQAETWERAAKGGSVARRFWKVAKCVGMSGGGAALGQVAGKQARWAAVGAAAGAVGCQFVF